MLNRRVLRIVAETFAFVMIAFFVLPAGAQTPEVKEKPPMYSYVSFWTIPRAQWAEMEKGNAGTQDILAKALASGSLVGYGYDENLVHSAEGFTHDSWWSSMSMAGLLNVLDQFRKSGSSTSPVLSSATKHGDGIFMSRYYNWHAGSWKDAYTSGAQYKLKANAPETSVEMLSKSLIVPLLEKLLAEGTIVEYEVDVEAVHSEAPGTFWIFYITPNADGIDKANAAIRSTIRSNPLSGPAFNSMTEMSGHRDYLSRTNATFK